MLPQSGASCEETRAGCEHASRFSGFSGKSALRAGLSETVFSPRGEENGQMRGVARHMGKRTIKDRIRRKRRGARPYLQGDGGGRASTGGEELGPEASTQTAAYRARRVSDLAAAQGFTSREMREQ